jgi:CSLREA domain-containing protein
MFKAIAISIVLLGTSLSLSTAQAATFYVNSTADPGDGVCDATCTIRDAILTANASPGQDEIDFSAITGGVPVSIDLLSGLPLITDGVIMDASIAESRVLPDGPTLRPGIELNLASAASVSGPSRVFHPDGLSFSGPGASGSIVRGFIINGLNSATHAQCLLAVENPDPISTAANPFPRQGFCGVPISIFAANNLIVAGNYLNLDSNGLIPSGMGKAAVEIVDGSNNVIGGRGPNDRNVITAAVPQPPGIDFATMVRIWVFGWSDPVFGAPKQANNNQIIGNYLGLTATGVSLDPILRGTWLAMWNIADDAGIFGLGQFGWGAQCEDQVNSPCEMIGNVVQGNAITATGGPSSVALFGPLRDTLVSDNTIFNAQPPLTGGPYGRIEVFGKEDFGFGGGNPEPFAPVSVIISNNRLGIDLAGNPSSTTSYGIGVGDGRDILITGNTVTGTVWDAIWAGSSPTGIQPQNVTITANSLFGNALGNALFGIDIFLGIGLKVNEGVTPNDLMDADTGPNKLQNFPEITYAKEKKGNIRIHGHLNSEAEKNYRIEFFANDEVNESGHGEGKRYLGSIDVSTNRDHSTNFDTKNLLNVGIRDGLVDVGDFITATATELCTADPEEGTCPYGVGGTSEFSAAVPVTK